MDEKLFTIKDMEKAFIAGINRGCYIASLIIGKPINEYPKFKDFIRNKYKKQNKEDEK